MRRETSGARLLLLLLAVLTVTANTGRGGVRAGGQGGVLPPDRHVEGEEEEEEVEEEVEEAARAQKRAWVDAEQGARWKWVMG